MDLPFSLRLKSKIVGSPLEQIAFEMRWFLSVGQRLRHPELMPLYLEGRHIRDIAKAVLRGNSIGIDGGAHIGSFLNLLQRFAPDGSHIAFEPSPAKCELLRRRFPKVSIHQCAVSDYSGTSWFREDKVNSGFSRLTEHEGTYQVEVRRLDDFDIAHVDLIKFDIEGNELRGFMGGEKVITRCRPFLIFECGTEYEKNDKLEIFQYLTNRLSYSIFTCADFLSKGEPLTIEAFRECGIYPFRALNFVGSPTPL